MKDQLKRVAETVLAGDPAKALKFAAGLNCLGDIERVVRLGHSARTSPAFYREIGIDPAAAEREAMAAIGLIVRDYLALKENPESAGS